MSISLDESAGVADAPTRKWKRLKKTSDIGDDERKRRQEHGRRVGGLNRVSGTISINESGNCIQCVYATGLGLTFISNRFSVNKNTARNMLLRRGVYRAGQPTRVSRPFKGGVTAYGPNCWQMNNKAIADDYAKEAEVLKGFDFDSYWEGRSRGALNYALNRGALLKKARDYYAKMSTDREWLAGRLNHTSAWRRSAKGVAWRAKNVDRIREHARKGAKKRRREDPYFRMSLNLRKRLRDLINGSGIGKMSELTGCSGAFLRAHIESAFTKGMSWANYGKWHCDHIVPCAVFDLSCPIQRKRCYHYSNLRPLWAKANMDKGASIEPCQPELVLCMAG